MKEFDFKKAKAGAKVCTRDGREARIVCWDKKGNYPIVALILNREDQDEDEDIRCYTYTGKYYTDSEHYSDLMLAVEKREGWINIYGGYCGDIHLSKEDALRERDEDICVDTIHIEWAE